MHICGDVSDDRDRYLRSCGERRGREKSIKKRRSRRVRCSEPIRWLSRVSEVKSSMVQRCTP